MNEVIIAAAKRIIAPGTASWQLPPYAWDFYDFWTKQQVEKGINFDKLIIKKPFKARSTGEKSQNHHANGHVQQLCMATGWDFEAMKHYTKILAIARGFPFDTLPDKSVFPWSETKIDSEQCGYWIDAIHQFADENGYVLREE